LLQQRMTRRVPSVWLALLLFAAQLLSLNTVSAANLETLLMPGKVSAAHAKLESECTNCHDRTNRVSQTALCMSCHKDIAADAQKRRGYHGRLATIAVAQCQGCHTEHKGRDADIVKFLPEQFDHERTDFPLRDAHTTLACNVCHVAGKKFREAVTSCVACHKKDEPHQGQLGADCAACHGAVTWLNAKFDHSKTRFMLSGKHAELQCAACHVGGRYKNTPAQCVACHAPDDVHQGSRGNNCEQCHSNLTWTTAKFDHAKETGFALQGAHARTDCSGCHTSGRMQDPIAKDCAGCHRAQDAHAGRMGQNCSQCHNSTGWRQVTFDHARDAKFALSTLGGAHVTLDCDSCHTANLATQKLGTSCSSCHRAQDVHVGQLGTQCEQCHVADSWRSDIRFDHDLTDFPLLGLHVTVACEQCHLTQQFKDTKSDCYSCHQAQDRHKGGLGKGCASCHTPNGWSIWEFDHNKATKFPLSGAHSKLECSACHKRPAGEVKLATECGACHVRDDVHFGQFGQQCQRCHTTISFKQVRMQ
jgi:hypothetical protein